MAYQAKRLTPRDKTLFLCYYFCSSVFFRFSDAGSRWHDGLHTNSRLAHLLQGMMAVS
jgi:hypothetical protein